MVHKFSAPQILNTLKNLATGEGAIALNKNVSKITLYTTDKNCTIWKEVLPRLSYNNPNIDFDVVVGEGEEMKKEVKVQFKDPFTEKKLSLASDDIKTFLSNLCFVTTKKIE
jgi:outer membrane protein assembly factor BamA